MALLCSIGFLKVKIFVFDWKGFIFCFFGSPTGLFYYFCLFTGREREASWMLNGELKDVRRALLNFLRLVCLSGVRERGERKPLLILIMADERMWCYCPGCHF